MTNLLFAVEAEDIDSVWYWREKQSAIPDEDGFTALHKATQKDYLLRFGFLHNMDMALQTGTEGLHFTIVQRRIILMQRGY